jgi:hypothetical protein
MEFTQREQQLMNTVKRVQRFRLSRLHPYFSRGESWLLMTAYESGTEGITVSELADRMEQILEEKTKKTDQSEEVVT